MSALSFLSKKSWHTALNSNQEAVWKAEKAALEERRKLDELRKERTRERELQELERLQAEAGGGKARAERVDWMYNAPSTGGQVDKDELEQYLLGKKRVDKLLKGADETTQLSRQGTGSSNDPISAQQNVNSDRDLSSKIRDDPMLAIRQQEQAAYQALLKDPARLRAMRSAAAGDKSDESREDRRRRKEEKRRRREGEQYDERRGEGSRRHRGEPERDSRDAPRDRREECDYARRADADRHRDSYPRRRDDDDSYRRERSYTPENRRRDDSYSHRRRREDDYDRPRHDDRERRQRQDPPHHDRTTRHTPARRSRSRSPARPSKDRDPYRRPASPRREPAAPRQTDASAEREAKLAAMQQNAAELTDARTAYLAKVDADEQADLAREEALRQKVHASRSQHKGAGAGFGAAEAKGWFLLHQERSLYGSANNMDLAERLRRGRDGLQRFDGGGGE